MRSTPLLTLRPAPDAVYMVAAAATPLGGDRVSLVVHVDAGATVRIRSVAAAVARPGPHGSEAHLSVRATVGPGARLVWEPEPGVAAAGCRMEAVAIVDMDDSAALWWRDEVVLGRSDETPGTWSSSLHVDRGGRPVLRHHLVVGEGSGPAVIGDNRAVASLAVVGDPPVGRVVHREAAWAVAMPLAHPGAALVSAAAPDHPTLRHLLSEVTRPGPA